jgi:TolA-binding protein
MNWNKSVVFVLLIALSAMWIMCASSKPDVDNTKQQEKQKVDELLGQTKTDNAQKDEDDVLKLLGIEPEKDKTKTDKKEMESQVGDLESKLNNKDNEITTLKTQLDNSNKKLDELEGVLGDLKSTPARQPITYGETLEGVSPDFQRRYESARNEYLNRNYNSAIRAFEDLLSMDASNSLSDNCRYWIGESYYGLDMHQQALSEFEKVFAFVDSNKEDAAQLKIGLCYKKLNQTANAKDAFNRLIMKYPKSEFIGLARQFLNEF